MGYQSEAQLEEKLVQKLKTQGYQFVEIPDYEALLANFRDRINEFNLEALEGNALTASEFTRILNYLSGKSVFQSAKQLRDQFILDRDDGTQVYLKFFDPVGLDRNVFQVTNQVTVEGKYTNRYDVTLLMNGLPIVQIELKRRGMDIKEAINQIDRYRVHSYKGLFHYVQIFVVSNGVETRYFSNTDAKRIPKGHTFYWTDEENNRINNLEEFSFAFQNRNRLMKMIDRFMVINDTDKALMIMRPYQVFATEALVSRALDTIEGGYIWHTTGSGKTLTSWKCANLLVQEPRIKKVFFLVDRKDLDNQTTQEFNKFEADCVDTTDKTNVLVRQIADKNKKLIVTTIQKMARALGSPRYTKIMEQYRDEKVIFIIDECHRTQFGDMHKAIKQNFTKGQFFGFTGTPRMAENKSQDNRTTADIFGKCLHTYLIKEAIFDHNVLSFSVEYISTYQGQYDEEDDTLVEDIDRDEIFMAKERIQLVAEHIIQHPKNKTRDGQYTSIFATSSIPALIRYYDTFKRLKHDLRIAAVFSFAANEDLEGKDEHSRDSLERIIGDYNEMFGTSFSTDTFSAYNADISNRLKVRKVPQIDILIVVNMYLTGFDSKPLNTLYVDKNLKYHDLLQAFSRTNRVEKDTKPFGNIVCYRNLKKNTDDAICLFSKTDHAEEVLMQSYEYYLDQFRALANELRLCVRTPEEIDTLQSEEDQARFVVAFRDLAKSLLILQTFSDFEWEDIEEKITQQEYEDFKSRYLTLHDNLSRMKDKEKVSILDDIDFSIEMMQTDKINVAYIMNLIKNIDLEDKAQQKKDIRHIQNELDRTDNPALRRKVDLIKKFLEDVVPNVQGEDSLEEAYSEFEDQERTKEIQSFAEEHALDSDVMQHLISEYEFSNILSKETIRQNIREKLTFIKMKRLIESVREFVVENVQKYQ